MIERIVTPKMWLRRMRGAALFCGGMGIVAGAFVTGPDLPIWQLLAKKPPSAGGERPAYAAGFAELARAVKPAVVAIVARGTEVDPASRGSPDAKSRLVTSQGSGFFITADGYAVTSNHVIKGSVSIEVRTDMNAHPLISKYFRCSRAYSAQAAEIIARGWICVSGKYLEHKRTVCGIAASRSISGFWARAQCGHW